MVNYTDMLAAYGIAKARPGGMTSTNKVLLENPLPNHAHVLEVGCGLGDTSKFIADKFQATVKAVDAHEKMIKKAKKRHGTSDNISFIHSDITSKNFPNDSFDAILCESVLSFNDINHLLQTFYQWLKPKGKLFLLEPVYHGGLTKEEFYQYKNFYGFSEIHASDSWPTLLKKYHFHLLKIYNSTEFSLEVEEDTFPEMVLDPSIPEDVQKLMESHIQLNENLIAYFDFIYIVSEK
ncbi:class I SAM-dependent methyltransferase [Bacillus shivajii]|uniref:class I SAM-dependent methyltransferase n=1 Tax=Bacillus shivajii TaxID=1983719 RepID=UPI001CFA6F15|nr:class I SAM-dependent methyltransferase [Bacillus shivajii]UCZ52055.1 class I SAM-dependent methyltransferase [Bacillus shivajii]